jgi:hypothetical protein
VKLRRDILLFGAVVVAAAVGVLAFLANRPGAPIEAFQREHRLRADAARPALPPADAFRATVCAASPCVVVEAGGLTFIFGAGEGAAEGIAQLGLMHPTVDGLLLPDLAVETVQGLPEIAVAGARAGRGEALKVFGPAGLLPVVDGANLVVSATEAARLMPGIEGEDQGAYGRIVFDSGVVSIRGFGGAEPGSGRVYRIDFDGRSLLLAGCTAFSASIIASAREAKSPAAIVFAGSERLLGSPSACIDLTPVLQAIAQARVASSVIVPGDPQANAPHSTEAWRELLAGAGPSGPQIGLTGTSIDLGGDAPRINKREK